MIVYTEGRVYMYDLVNIHSITFDISDKTTVTDIDGNVYQILSIGTQVWMMENLKVTHYRNGDGGFTSLSESADFWSATAYDIDYVWYRFLSYCNLGVFRYYGSLKRYGFSIRCVMD